MGILNDIVADKRDELAAAKRRAPLGEVKRAAADQPPPKDFAAALGGVRIRVIAEVKRASPSRGLIAAEFDPVTIARRYAENGAAAISVLTESKHFQGSLEYLASVRRALGERRPPLLRKDFIIDPYQVFESRAAGADALLLIAAILDPGQLGELAGLAHTLGMKCLVEVHDEGELAAVLATPAQVIGINNRDLRTFEVSLETTGRLRPLVPADRLVVSESGIKGRADMERLQAWGVNAALVGEALMTAPDVGAKIRELLG